MSAPQAKWSIYDELVEAELKHWPGVTWTRQVRSKHYALVLAFEGVSRFVTYPCSPSDRRGALNHVSTVKGVLREMGAKRRAPMKSGRPRTRKPRREIEPPPLRIVRPEPIRPERDPSRDPWAVLAEMKFEDKPEPMPRRRDWFRVLFGRKG